MLCNEKGQSETIIIVIVLGIVFSLLIYFVLQPEEKISILEVRPDNEKLTPGGSTTLTVKIKNVAREGVASGVSVTVTPSKPFIEVRSENPISIGTLDSGEESWLDFSIFISQDAIDGKWKIEVSTSADSPFKGDTTDKFIIVESAT